MKAQIIAVGNQKGGVAKTTTSVNLAQALHLYNLRVLLVDFDPQGSATQSLGFDIDRLSCSIAHVIRDPKKSVRQIICRPDFADFDLVPSCSLLSNVKLEMPGMINGELILRRKLAEVADEYDVIIVDMSPDLGPLMNSALNAADQLIVPVDPGPASLQGIPRVLYVSEAIKEGFNPNLRILGFLMTLNEENTNIARATWDNLVAEYGDLVFETKINKCVKLREAPSFGKTIFSHAPDSRGGVDHANLATEVIMRAGLPGFVTESSVSQELASGVCHE